MLTRRHAPLGALLLLVVLLYANSFGNSFHFDDSHAIVDNPAIRSLGNLPRIFRDATAFSVLPANQTYRPLVTASLAFDYALGHGLNVFWFHLSTMLWFLLLVGLLFFLAKHLFDLAEFMPVNQGLALFVAAWFGLHPAMAETVNYVIQRGDLYCTLGSVAALLLYAARPEWRRFGSYLLPFAAALLSKPPAAVFPLLLLLYVFLFEDAKLSAPARFRRALWAAFPAAMLDALLLWLQSAMTPKTYAPSIGSASAYRLTQPYVWLRYCTTLFLPLHLNVDTDLQPFPHWNTQAVAGVAFTLALLLAVFFTFRRRRLAPIAFGLCWFFLTQLPTSLYTLSEVENDHRMFFSFPGLMIAVVWSLALLAQRLAPIAAHRRRLLAGGVTALAVCVLSGYAVGTYRRNQVWRSDETLWADDVQKSPHNGRGLMNYGLVKMSAGDYSGARTLFTNALVLTPNYPTLEINLGIDDGSLALQGHPALRAEAEAHFQRALRLAPADDTTHSFYGRWLLAEGRTAEAVTQLQAAIRLNGQREMARDLLLTAYTTTGDLAAAHSLAVSTLALIPGDKAASAVLRGTSQAATPPGVASLIDASLLAYQAGHFQDSIAKAREALHLDPRSSLAWNNVGAGYGALHQWPEAIAAEREALRFDPGLAIASNNLRWFLVQAAQTAATSRPAGAAANDAARYVALSLTLNQQGRYAESLAAAQKAVALDPNSAEGWNNIAANDEALHRWEDAIAAAEHALRLRPDFQLARNNLIWSQQQKLLKPRRP